MRNFRYFMSWMLLLIVGLVIWKLGVEHWRITGFALFGMILAASQIVRLRRLALNKKPPL